MHPRRLFVMYRVEQAMRRRDIVMNVIMDMLGVSLSEIAGAIKLNIYFIVNIC